MPIHQYKAFSFSDYVKIITEIGEYSKINLPGTSVLWSRGHRRQDWNLIPTLLRDTELAELPDIGNASGRAMEEEIRKQHYIAKNYHFFTKDPKTKVEWMEVMQHHGVKTRLLDWSESTLHSLIFALECFFDNNKYRSADRIDSTPCVWVLEPIPWNIEALNRVLTKEDLLYSCIDSLQISDDQQKTRIKERMGKINNIYEKYMEIKTALHLRSIFNLSSMMDEIQSLRANDLLYILEKGELHYCLAYLLTNVYLTTEPRILEQVMPLSIVQSYHSERIKAQKGSFTIFPYYKEDSLFQSAKHMKIPLDAMEYMHKGNRFLHKILLCSPDQIASEVINAGLNISWLYPEMPVVANAIENRGIFI